MSDVTGENPGGDDDGEHNPVITGESKLYVPIKTTEERFATWTESLGSESFNERLPCGDTQQEEGRYQSPAAGAAGGVGVRTVSGLRRGKRKRKSTWLDMSYFPPLLSTLNKNGRPGFDCIKTRENGRLQIKMVPSERPGVVALQTPPMRKDKRLKMLLIKTKADDDHDQDQPRDPDDDQEIRADDDNQDQKEDDRLESNAGDGAPDHEV